MTNVLQLECMSQCDIAAGYVCTYVSDRGYIMYVHTHYRMRQEPLQKFRSLSEQHNKHVWYASQVRTSTNVAQPAEIHTSTKYHEGTLYILALSAMRVHCTYYDHSHCGSHCTPHTALAAPLLQYSPSHLSFLMWNTASAKVGVTEPLGTVRSSR